MSVLKICGKRGLRLVKTKIVIEVQNCGQCPYIKYLPVEYGKNIFCRKAQKMVAEMIEYMGEFDDKTPPEWCPCRLEEK